MPYTIKRAYVRRNDAKPIGEAMLRVTDSGSMEMRINDTEWKTLSDAATEHLLNFALQTLQDAYAGATSYADAKDAWEKKADRIISGSIGVRGTSVDVWTLEARKIMLAQVRANAGASAKFKAVPAKERNDWLDARIEANAGNDKFKKLVDEAVKRRNAAPTVDIDFDL